jgi:hypothetical protein
MAGKDDPTRLTAPASIGVQTDAERPKTARKAMSEDKSQARRNKHDAKQESTMGSNVSSDLCNPPRDMMDRSLQAQLGRQLRAIFSDVAQEPVPDRFIRLLEALGAREKQR